MRQDDRAAQEAKKMEGNMVNKTAARKEKENRSCR